ncbi:MAG: DUF4339 domain-containing protein [Methylacidiphilales bacterium]|nr:DUF4339 domain-containing protein [Candidatus Methylacidiphilales bacterium]
MIEKDFGRDMLAIYILKKGKQSGPYTEEEVRQDLARGAWLPSDLARQEGIDKWLPITQLLSGLPVEKSPSLLPQNLQSANMPNLRNKMVGDLPAGKPPSAPPQNLQTANMPNLHGRITSHADKVKELEEMEAVLAGVFNREAQACRNKFAVLVQDLIKPAFHEFKATLREIGRDAVIITNLAHNHQVLSIGLTLIDRYLSFGAGKTVKLVNPDLDISKRTNAKFYEVYCSDDYLCVRQRTDPHGESTIKSVAFQDITPAFLENELTAFFERAYPATG